MGPARLLGLAALMALLALVAGACSSGAPRVGPPAGSDAHLAGGAQAQASADARDEKLTAAELEQYFADAEAPQMNCVASDSAWDYECHFTNPAGERVKLGVLVNECAPVESTGWVAVDGELPAPSEVWEHAQCHGTPPPVVKPPTALAQAERAALAKQRKMVRLERQFIALLEARERKEKALRRKAVQVRDAYRALAKATDRYRRELAASLDEEATALLMAPYRKQAKGLRLAARGVEEFRRSLKSDDKALARRGLKKIARGEALMQQAGEALDLASGNGAPTQRLY